QPFGYQLRRMMAYGLRASEFAMGGARWLRDVPIPDLIQQGQRPHIVIKSVSSRGRARLFADALPASRIIFILRHPCGQVSSMMRGVAIGKFDTTELGLESGRSEARTLVEQLGLGLGNGKPKGAQRLFWEGRVCHGAIRRTNCEAPTVVAKNLFAFAGLSWDPQTAAFLEASTTYAGPTDTIKYSRIRANRRTPVARIFLKPSKDEFLILSVMSQRRDYLRNKRAVEQQSYRPSLRQVAPIRYPEWPRSYPECHGMYLDHLREGIWTNIVDAIGSVTCCRI